MSALLQTAPKDVQQRLITEDATTAIDGYFNGLPYKSGALAITTAGAIAGYQMGLPIASNGRLCVTNSAPTSIANGSMPIVNGRLAFGTAGTGGYIHGVPFTADGRLSAVSTSAYSATAYADALKTIVDAGVSGGMWILDESASANAATDYSRFGNNITSLGTPTVNQTSFINDSRKSTLIDQNNGYQRSGITLFTLTGCIGCFYDQVDANGVNNFRVDFAANKRFWFGYNNPTTFNMVALCTPASQQTQTFPVTAAGSPHVIYINYTASGTTLDMEIFIDFVSVGTLTFTFVGATWTLGTNLISFGRINGLGSAKMQYAFATDHRLTATEISTLQLAYTRNL